MAMMACSTDGGGDTQTRSRFGASRRRRELLALLDPYEPRATPIIVDVEALGVVPWRQRAWVVERDGRPAAIVVLSRAAIDRWFARCVLIDEAAAPSVAAIVDRSSAWIVTGSGLDVGPVHPHLRRARELAGMPWVVVEHPAPRHRPTA